MNLGPVFKTIAVIILFFGYGLSITTFIYSNFVSAKQYESDKASADHSVEARFDRLELQINEVKNILIQDAQSNRRR